MNSTLHRPHAPVRTVTIPARAEHEGIYSRTVRLVWRCPVCGGARGDIHEALSYDGSRRLHVDGWTNACGHVDKYADVRKEADANGLNGSGSVTAASLAPHMRVYEPRLNVWCTVLSAHETAQGRIAAHLQPDTGHSFVTGYDKGQAVEVAPTGAGGDCERDARLA